MGRGDGNTANAINDEDINEYDDHEEHDDAMLEQFMGTKVEKTSKEKKEIAAKKKTKAQMRKEEKTLTNCCIEYKQAVIINVICFTCFLLYLFLVLPAAHD